MSLHLRVVSAFIALAGLTAAPARAAVDPARAQEIFQEAAQLCGHDAGALWHHSLCGPILLVDWHDNAVVANQADAGGALKAAGPVFIGTLPADAIVANTPVEWSGTRWTEMVWPLPDDVQHRHVMISHELFHRAQIELGMLQRDGSNVHLDSLEGRVLLQLEWHALARALNAPDVVGRRAAIADALLFRHQRYRLFPDAQAEERALEINEGVAEYTGVRVGLPTPQERTAYALHDLQAFVAAPTFVRSFAYATGPAYGLLLDQADPAWRGKLASGQGLDQLLQSALKLSELPASALPAREAAYDPALRPREVARDEAKQARLAALRARLVDGPVLTLPLAHVHSSYQFNPQTLQPLAGAGIVYPTMRVSADWGVLEVEQDALMDKEMTLAAVSAVGLSGPDMQAAKGEGWHLALSKGWTLAPGARAGDFVVRKAPGIQ